MGVFVRPDSPFYWIWLEPTKTKERTSIPVLRRAAVKERRAARRLAEELYGRRMIEILSGPAASGPCGRPGCPRDTGK
jgi:hypothetical protein